MREEFRQFYSYLGPRWGGGASVHLEFCADGLPLHVEAVQDNVQVPDWIIAKMSEAQQEELLALFDLSRPHREELDTLMAAMLAAEAGE